MARSRTPRRRRSSSPRQPPRRRDASRSPRRRREQASPPASARSPRRRRERSRSASGRRRRRRRSDSSLGRRNGPPPAAAAPAPAVVPRAPPQPRQGCSGVVRMWNEEKGFGFVTDNAGGEDCFVHCSAFGGGSLAVGRGLHYDVVLAEDGRPRAENAHGEAVLEERPAAPPPAPPLPAPAAGADGGGGAPGPADRVRQRQELRRQPCTEVWERSPSPPAAYRKLRDQLQREQRAAAARAAGGADDQQLRVRLLRKREGGAGSPAPSAAGSASASDSSSSSGRKKKKKKGKKDKKKKKDKKDKKKAKKDAGGKKARKKEKKARKKEKGKVVIELSSESDTEDSDLLAEVVAAAAPPRRAADDEEVGPLPVDAGIAAVANYGGHLLPGEGSAMAQYVQDNKRIPRRGEIGLNAEEIESYEDLGYVMSGSRHKRMNAVRIRKENQVYSAEERRALAVVAKEERIKREAKVIQSFRELLNQKGVDVAAEQGGDDPPKQ
eukprot:TRINITY_DN1206_c2_g1_i1.p1 TRINITY_DN1206_c2_g1~~TRINITY_DN1206_c2_g1_i1.p1  ORF type:complete len:495 (+),score=191.35 TRINITY_DN1206_c2_g1_i1:62-1546(+)